MRTVKDIFETKTKSFNQVSPSTLVIDALNLLNSVNLSYLVVMDGDAYKGVFSERDYTRNVILKGRASNTTRVDEVMTTDLPIVTLTDTVEHCMRPPCLQVLRKCFEEVLYNAGPAKHC